MNYIVNEMSRENAEIISKWTYENEYSIYSFINDQETIEELMNGTYYSVKNENNDLIGYFCYGIAAQVPAGKEFDVYIHDDYLDIGLGMAPENCGQKQGKAFLLKGIEFAQTKYDINHFRLTVAEFNQRAIKVYESVGFTKLNRFVRKNNKGGIAFLVMLRE